MSIPTSFLNSKIRKMLLTMNLPTRPRVLTGFLLLCLVSVISAASLANENPHPQRAQLILALEEMLPQTSDAFVVVQVAGTQQFIQFYSDNAGLLMDLPAVALTEAENKRATLFFEKNDVPQASDVAVDPETEQEFTLIVWRREFAHQDTAVVADLSLQALQEIYQISRDAELEFLKGWE